MFRFFKRKSTPETVSPEVQAEAAPDGVAAPTLPTVAEAPQPQAAHAAVETPALVAEEQPASGWFNRLRSGLRKTGAGISGLFGGSRIDEALYEELEAALIMADAGMPATTALLADLRKRVKAARAETPQQVRALLADALADLLAPLQKPLDIGLSLIHI